MRRSVCRNNFSRTSNVQRLESSRHVMNASGSSSPMPSMAIGGSSGSAGVESASIPPDVLTAASIASAPVPSPPVPPPMPPPPMPPPLSAGAPCSTRSSAEGGVGSGSTSSCSSSALSGGRISLCRAFSFAVVAVLWLLGL